MADLAATDRDGSFASVYGARGDLLVLIRPDGQIARIAATDRSAAIAKAVALMAAGAASSTAIAAANTVRTTTRRSCAIMA